MRCTYFSDLHLEAQEFSSRLPGGDILIVAGDLCHANCLDPRRTDKYSIDQRTRVLRFADAALQKYRHVLLVAGNHEHYDNHFELTVPALRTGLPGFTVLDDDFVSIGGYRFFGATLWTDFNGCDKATMDAVRRKMGEYFFVKTTAVSANGQISTVKFRPEDAAAACARSLTALETFLASPSAQPAIVITHHAPSHRSVDERYATDPRTPAYASAFDDRIANLYRVPYWVHGHTHVRRRYQIGQTTILTNGRGFEKHDAHARSFQPDTAFDLP